VEKDDIPLPENLIVDQIKAYKDKKMRKAKSNSYLFASVSQMIMTRIMTLKSPKEIWEYLKAGYEGNENIQGMNVVKLIKKFEMQRMKKSETIKEYSNKLLGIANKIKLLEKEFPYSRLVEKIMVTVSEIYEASIASLENIKDLSTITLTEVIHVLQAQEQRRLMREDHDTVEGNLNYTEENALIVKNNRRSKYNHIQVFHLVPIARKKVITQLVLVEAKCQMSQMQSIGTCGKCIQIVKDKVEEELLLTTSCVITNKSTKDWIIDSGCTNHMTHDK